MRLLKKIIQQPLITLIFMTSVHVGAFQLPLSTILENNMTPRIPLKTAILSHEIKFFEGFFSEVSFSCKETLYYQAPDTVRADYTCGTAKLSLVSSSISRKMIYNQTITSQEITPFNFMLALLLTGNMDTLIQSLSHAQFIEAQPVIQDDTQNDQKKWDLTAEVSLARLGKIEKSTPTKLEKNLAFLIQSGNHRIWLEKDFYFPQKVENESVALLFQKYRDLPSKTPKLLFRYPQTIEIQESGNLGLSIQTAYDQIVLNPKLDAAVFQAALLSKKSSSPFSENTAQQKEVLEKFISLYR